MGKYWSISVNPIDVSLIKLFSINPDFFNSLLNPYLKRSYESQLIAGMSSSLLLNNSKRGEFLNSTILRLNIETSGNLLNAMSGLLQSKQGSEDDPHYNFMGIRYAQYVRGEANFSYRIPLGASTSLVYRLYGGLGVAYGNSSSIPFERMFYCGGSNSMRGWQARTLGPGNSTIVRPEYPQQLGNVKLETNLELRFPVANIIHGALFFDLGNVWITGSGVTEESEFKWNRFYRQFGFNTGIGTRLDFGFFVLRLDWGIRLFDPNLAQNNRWIDSFRLKNTTLNFAVGYPF
jgi:outer membrane protein assembly factor BamA